ncbi:NADH-dependent flavin oxidoreductase [Nocardioides salsibiostraticola]
MTHRDPDCTHKTLADPLALPHGEPVSNRFFLAPLTNKQSHGDGTLSEDEYAFLVRRAAGGFGLTKTCAAYVAPAGQAWSGQLGVSRDEHLPGLTRLADGLRATGTRSAVQLHHGGRRSDPALHGGDNVAPWDDQAKQTRALTTAEVEQAIEDFVAAAERAERAGFDGVEVHGAHGYLIGQFLDGRHNLREDGYGGSLADRSRVLFDVLEGIRARTGPNFQLGLRLTPQGAGIVLDEGLAVAERAMTCGLIDYLDMSLWDVYGKDTEGDLVIDRFAALPRGETALGVAGKILSTSDACWCVEHGADFVTIGTAAILHHDFPIRASADAGFVSVTPPVSREHLLAESVGPSFVEYLAEGWDDFVL